MNQSYKKDLENVLSKKNINIKRLDDIMVYQGWNVTEDEKERSIEE